LNIRPFDCKFFRCCSSSHVPFTICGSILLSGIGVYCLRMLIHHPVPLCPKRSVRFLEELIPREVLPFPLPGPLARLDLYPFSFLFGGVCTQFHRQLSEGSRFIFSYLYPLPQVWNFFSLNPDSSKKDLYKDCYASLNLFFPILPPFFSESRC